VICLDLHCPWIFGEHNENIYLVGSQNDTIAAQEKQFCKLLTIANAGELKISDKVYMKFGIAWNTLPVKPEGLSFDNWAATLDGVKLPITIEFPYSNNEGQMINQQNSREFGCDLANAIKLYLQQL
jgi:hypothetical protein